jgi:squalene-hopene/tetraprenyl-beta-curcumene cyclase
MEDASGLVSVEGAAMTINAALEGGDLAGNPDALASALHAVRDRLLQAMEPEGFWEGRLSSSALATATAVSALAASGSESDGPRIAAAIAWLCEHHHADGGWGDSPESPSNLATTLLSVAALKLAAAAGIAHPLRAGALEKGDKYLAAHAGRSSRDIVEALQREYGGDRTFAVPILMNCGLAGLVAWEDIPGLPFELAVLPHACYRALRLHVVSYALPALIAIGLLLDRRSPPRNHLRRFVRRGITRRVLEKLRQIQPESGGFLEAAPLTSFVAMGLIPLFGPGQPVAARCLQFLRQSQRADRSWPIDTNLSVWLTTATVTALAAAGELPRIDRPRTAQWLAARQYKTLHPYTHAAPGAWAWTDRSGGVPDVDDTAGAILALAELGHRDGLDEGLQWLLDLQNGDGGWPTFCRGWGKLPFDRSAPDLTAHVLRAMVRADLARTGSTPANRGHARRQQTAIRRGLEYLDRVQQADGSWIPLWFGNQAAPGQTNPVLGTARVLRALEVLDSQGRPAARGVEYLLGAQNADGGWGGAKGVASSVEETALAVGALAAWASAPAVGGAVLRGVEYLVRQAAEPAGRAAPVGLYFSHLWYSEQLYPLIWTLEALGRAANRANSPAAHVPV